MCLPLKVMSVCIFGSETDCFLKFTDCRFELADLGQGDTKK